MEFFNINYTELIRLLLPVKLRGARMRAWLAALVKPARTLYGWFVAWRNNNNYYIAHNGQICHLEGVLNDRFDAGLKRIRIVDGPFKDPKYIYRRDENRPTYLARRSELPVTAYNAPLYLPRREETVAIGYQFIVYYPVGLVFSEVEMRALIDKYRLASKKKYGILPDL